VSETPSETATQDYDSLPAVEGGARSGWGIFGLDDNVGLLNLQTNARIAAATGLVQRGQVFTLDVPVDFLGPPIEEGRRGAPKHTLSPRYDIAFDDHLDGFFLQGTTQWDALGHVAFKPDVFYNGVTADQIRSGKRNTIHYWAQRGIIGRCVLLDLVRLAESRGRRIDPFGDYSISVDDLEAARHMGGFDYRPGDVILVRTGHCEGLAAQPVAERRVPYDQLRTPGLEHSEAMVRYIWNTHASALAADNVAVEVWPSVVDLAAIPTDPGWPFGYSHNIYIGLFGLALGEYFWLADLAVDCAADGRYEMFFCSVPLNVPGGVGSPASAVAIK
jgi:Putative cyclase